MSNIEDPHPSDRADNEVEEVINKQNKPLRTDGQNYAQLTKRIKLDDPCQLVLLNDDILHHLFSFFNIQELVKMRRVCKVWQIVTRQKIKFASCASFYYYVIPVLSDNCPNRTRLTLYSIEMSQTLCKDLGRCIPPNLKTLAIIECHKLKDRGFKKILGNCINLENLVIDCSVTIQGKFKGLSIIESLKTGQLKKLSLIECDYIYEVMLFRIMLKFTSSLRELNLQCVGAAEKYGVCMHAANNLAGFKFNLLETLSLHGYQFYELNMFVHAMPSSLNTLKLHDCQFNAGNNCYFRILPKCVPLLKELHIVNSLPLYRRDIYFLSELENLETLVLCGLFDICNHAKYGRHNINFCDWAGGINMHCHSLPDQAKEGLLTYLVSVIIKCPKLKTVIFDDVLMLNDDHVFTMISSMSSLRFLKVVTSSKIVGSFVSKCTDLDRTEPIKVKLIKHEVKVDPFPVIPLFMELCLA